MAAIVPSPAINNSAKPHILAINVGSSSIKFALFEVGDFHERQSGHRSSDSNKRRNYNCSFGSEHHLPAKLMANFHNPNKGIEGKKITGQKDVRGDT